MIIAPTIPIIPTPAGDKLKEAAEAIAKLFKKQNG